MKIYGYMCNNDKSIPARWLILAGVNGCIEEGKYRYIVEGVYH